MARTLTPKDGFVVLQDIVNQLMAADEIDNIDFSSYVSVAQAASSFTQEKVFNAVNLSLGRMIMAVRPIDEAFNIIQAIDSGDFSDRFRKISFYSKNTLPSGMYNTDLYTNHATGYNAGVNGDPDQTTGRTPSTKSQWEQNLAVPLEMNFGGSTTWQYCITNLVCDGKYAFEDENEWAAFLNGYMEQHANDLKMEREAFKRATFLSMVATEYAIGTSTGAADKGIARNLTAEFNDKFNTEYTTAQLLSTYLSDFLAFFVSVVKKDSKRMRRNTVLEHIYPAKQENGVDLVLPRHTPRNYQKLALLDSFWIDAEAYVMPKIFNPEFLDIGNFESIEFWQNPAAPSEVDFTSAVPGWINSIMTGGTSTSDTTGTAELSYFLGALFDRDACLVDMAAERALTSGVEARKGFSNTWITFRKDAIVDPTEKVILYYLADPATDDDDEGGET